MRMAQLCAVFVVCLMGIGTGCSRTVDGAAGPDPHMPGTTISADGFGVIAGNPGAGIQIELYTEPQCSHCAHLQGQYGPQLKTLINLGELAVTYRPVTFLDQGPNGYSARVSNALFLAAAHGTSGPAFQTFVQDVWGHQQPFSTGPTDAELAVMADESHVDPDAVSRIRSGQPGVDTDDMSSANEGRLEQILRDAPSTPAVYDLTRNKLIDTSQNDWLTKLMASKVAT
ncbi:MAG: thioredoxin domain-containing protein [Mycobacterium sp.]